MASLLVCHGRQSSELRHIEDPGGMKRSLVLALVLGSQAALGFILPSLPHARAGLRLGSCVPSGGDCSPQPAAASPEGAATPAEEELELEPALVFDKPMKDQKDRFLVDITIPEPTAAELDEANLVKIVKQQCTDEEVNMLAWKCLGYRYIPSEGRWDNTNVFPKWRARYPTPPDVVGVTRIYEKAVDAPVKAANTGLVRSIPKTYKQSLKELLAPYGFTGFKIAQLTPNRTRRAQVCNWILYYKRDLWGVPLEELMARKGEVTEKGTREGQTPEELGQKMVY